MPRRGSLETLMALTSGQGISTAFLLLGQMWHLGEHTVFPTSLFNMRGRKGVETRMRRVCVCVHMSALTLPLPL